MWAAPPRNWTLWDSADLSWTEPFLLPVFAWLERLSLWTHQITKPPLKLPRSRSLKFAAWEKHWLWKNTSSRDDGFKKPIGCELVRLFGCNEPIGAYTTGHTLSRQVLTFPRKVKILMVSWSPCNWVVFHPPFLSTNKSTNGKLVIWDSNGGSNNPFHFRGCKIPVNNGKNYLLSGAGFLPSTVPGPFINQFPAGLFKLLWNQNIQPLKVHDFGIRWQVPHVSLRDSLINSFLIPRCGDQHFTSYQQISKTLQRHQTFTKPKTSKQQQESVQKCWIWLMPPGSLT